ncbi:hypothetical protein LguiA_009595 [Lonicera macranthoides]
MNVETQTAGDVMENGGCDMNSKHTREEGDESGKVLADEGGSKKPKVENSIEVKRTEEELEPTYTYILLDHQLSEDVGANWLCDWLHCKSTIALLSVVNPEGISGVQFENKVLLELLKKGQKDWQVDPCFPNVVSSTMENPLPQVCGSHTSLARNMKLKSDANKPSGGGRDGGGGRGGVHGRGRGRGRGSGRGGKSRN